jgi:copper chaperone
MKKIYALTGMSCGGCVNNVKQTLLQLPDVKEAEVQLNPQRAALTMSKSVDVAELQAQLSKAGHYTIKEAF